MQEPTYERAERFEPPVDDAKAIMRRVRKQRIQKAVDQFGPLLFALNVRTDWQGKPQGVYEGTTKRSTALAKRRAKNKVASASRKANR